MLSLEDAKEQARTILAPFVGLDVLSVEDLNEIEDRVNTLIWKWSQEDYFVVDEEGNTVSGVKIWLDNFDSELRFRYRYPSDTDQEV